MRPGRASNDALPNQALPGGDRVGIGVPSGRNKAPSQWHLPDIFGTRTWLHPHAPVPHASSLAVTSGKKCATNHHGAYRSRHRCLRRPRRDQPHVCLTCLIRSAWTILRSMDRPCCFSETRFDPPGTRCESIRQHRIRYSAPGALMSIKRNHCLPDAAKKSSAWHHPMQRGHTKKRRGISAAALSLIAWRKISRADRSARTSDSLVRCSSPSDGSACCRRAVPSHAPPSPTCARSRTAA